AMFPGAKIVWHDDDIALTGVVADQGTMKVFSRAEGGVGWRVISGAKLGEAASGPKNWGDREPHVMFRFGTFDNERIFNERYHRNPKDRVTFDYPVYSADGKWKALPDQSKTVDGHRILQEINVATGASRDVALPND